MDNAKITRPRLERMLNGMPLKMQNKVTQALENISLVAEIRDPKVGIGMLPSAYRGLWQKKGKGDDSALMKSGHPVHFDLNYGSDFPEMYDLYRRAVANQWDGEWQLDWSTQVDPMNPEVPILGSTPFIPFDDLQAAGVSPV